MSNKKIVVSIALLTVLLSLLLVSPVAGVVEPTPQPPRTLKVWKFSDIDGDGVLDPEDFPKEGWLIKVGIQTDAGWIYIAEGTTGADGTVTFTDLPLSKNGNYRVWEEARECWRPTWPADGWFDDGGYYVVRYISPEGGEARVKFMNTYECGGDGCTLTPGYWKTHSAYGPAPYDDIWAQIGEDTPFFLSGQTYYQVLWTEPSGGNAYYILAHAYIAAELNVLNGASIPDDVLNAWNEATILFHTYTPDDVAAMKRSDPALRGYFLSLAETLDYYNNGLIGPGHCSE